MLLPNMYGHTLDGNAFSANEEKTVARPAASKGFTVNNTALNTCENWFKFMHEQGFNSISVEFEADGETVAKACGTMDGVASEVTPPLRKRLEGAN